MIRFLLHLCTLLVPTLGVICPADITGGITGAKDGFVNVEDVIVVLRDYGSSISISDINKNSVVDVEDVLTVLKSYGRTDCDKPVSIQPVVDYCPKNPKQTCRSLCPTKASLQKQLHCRLGQCIERVGSCCQFRCSHISSCGVYPCGCTLFYDGCNRCSIHNGKKQTCTNMACFTHQPSYCITYVNGTQCTGVNKCSSDGGIVIGRPFLHKETYLLSDAIIIDWDL